MNEYLPVIKLTDDGRAIVAGRRERTAAHVIDPALHITTLIVPITPSGDLILVDKTPKDKLKARMRGLTPPPDLPSLDCFGGHMEYGSIPAGERVSGISASTYLACAIRELGEEFVIDGKNAVPDRSAFSFIGFFTSYAPDNMEHSAAYYYKTDRESGFGAQDNVGSEYVDLPVYKMSPEELRSCRYHIADGLSRIITSIAG